MGLYYANPANLSLGSAARTEQKNGNWNVPTVSGGLLVFGMAASTEAGTADAAVTSTNTTLTDTRKAWTVNDWIGAVVRCNGKSLTVTSNTATVMTGVGWTAGGNPGNGNSYTVSGGRCNSSMRGATRAYDNASNAFRDPWEIIFKCTPFTVDPGVDCRISVLSFFDTSLANTNNGIVIDRADSTITFMIVTGNVKVGITDVVTAGTEYVIRYGFDDVVVGQQWIEVYDATTYAQVGSRVTFNAGGTGKYTDIGGVCLGCALIGGSGGTNYSSRMPISGAVEFKLRHIYGLDNSDTFFGPHYNVGTQLATADSATKQWSTVGSANHWDNVDTDDATTSYNHDQDGTTTQLDDILDLPAWPGDANLECRGLWLWVRSRWVLFGNNYLFTFGDGTNVLTGSMTQAEGLGTNFDLADGRGFTVNPDGTRMTKRQWDSFQIGYRRQSGGSILSWRDITCLLPFYVEAPPSLPTLHPLLLNPHIGR